MSLSGEPIDHGHILRRAEEIAADEARLLQNRPDVRDLVLAAEETGLSREAVLAALRERLAEKTTDLQSGDLVFALSADSHWYPAVFQNLAREQVKLRYFNGGEGTVSLTDIKPFTLAPGLKIQTFSQSYKMWIDSEVTRYNPDSRSVATNYWYTEDIVTLERIRLKGENQFVKNLPAKAKYYLTLAATAIGSASIAAIVTALILR